MAKKKQDDGPQPWVNKIVGHDEVDPRELVANDMNWRRHPASQASALTGAIDKIGFIRSVTVNKRTGRIVDGHLRLKLALDSGQPSIPVEYVDLSEEEEKAALLTLDPLAAMAETSAEALDTLLRDVNFSTPELQAMAASLADAAGLYKVDGKAPAGGDGEGESGDGGEGAGGEGEGEAASNITDPGKIGSYTVIFDDVEQQQTWFRFVRGLKDKYPDATTIGERLVKFIGDMETAG